MIDPKKRQEKQRLKEQTRQRMRVEVDPDKYEYRDAIQPPGYYDNDLPLRVAIYVRVSTDDVRQTTSFELQQKYYQDFIVRHPSWSLVKIYADEGISGTSLAHRDRFNEMIADCRAGKIDLIITKNVSRFARNVVICIGIVRELAELKKPVGVFFESEAIYSLNDDTQMALSFMATMAEEESHTRSRSMETSLRMRLDHGIPLIPKRLGFVHDEINNLTPNEEEAPTVKLMYFLIMFGCSTEQTAEILTALQRKTFLGNTKWTAGTVLQILRSERNCGYVITRKTYTPNFRDHKSKKNRGQRPQSTYKDHHTAIISRDDFIAVQRLLDNSKYRNKDLMPQLRVVESGLLKGFVGIHTRWAGFKDEDYYRASQSAYDGTQQKQTPLTITAVPGDFDLRGFEVARTELFDTRDRPVISINNQSIKFNVECVRRYQGKNEMELLINPVTRALALRPAPVDIKYKVVISRKSEGRFIPTDVASTAFSETLYAILGWNQDYRYRIVGSFVGPESGPVVLFDAQRAEAFVKASSIPVPADDANNLIGAPFMAQGSYIRTIPEAMVNRFGDSFYAHERSMKELAAQSEEDWKMYIGGRLVRGAENLNITPFGEIRAYIKFELGDLMEREDLINEIRADGY